jgi:hypothetical protein
MNQTSSQDGGIVSDSQKDQNSPEFNKNGIGLATMAGMMMNNEQDRKWI